MDIVKVGEIWETEQQNGTIKEVILLQCFDDYAAVLTLVDSEPKQNAMRVKSLSLKYVDCGRPGYCFYDKLTTYIRTISDEDMAKLKKNIIDALELSVSPEPVETIVPEINEELKSHSDNVVDEATQQKCEKLEQRLNDSALELTVMTGERDIYKDLYDRLVEKVIKP